MFVYKSYRKCTIVSITNFSFELLELSKKREKNM